jgi:DNA-binding winged helix-turn-helix (wHTH) protein
MNEERIAFGDVGFGVFELDLRARELRKGDLRLKLDGKPFKVLELLVERAGEVVTRKELLERLWPDSFVDFDRNIYSTVNRLRKMLGDTADPPRYIETRFRLGYRLVAPVAANAAGRPGLRPFDVKLAGKPSLTGLRVQGPSPAVPFVATSNAGFDGNAFRFEVRRPSGELAELILSLTTTNEGALNMRLHFGAAGPGRDDRFQAEVESGAYSPIRRDA